MHAFASVVFAFAITAAFAAFAANRAIAGAHPRRALPARVAGQPRVADGLGAG
jgi:hypothetical protein